MYFFNSIKRLNLVFSFSIVNTKRKRKAYVGKICMIRSSYITQWVKIRKNSILECKGISQFSLNWPFIYGVMVELFSLTLERVAVITKYKNITYLNYITYLHIIVFLDFRFLKYKDIYISLILHNVMCSIYIKNLFRAT